MFKKISSISFLSYLLLFFFLILGFSLRFINLTKIPQGFSWDEAAIGYNAYSLLKTGKDEFGKPWPIFLESFGDFKTSFYSILIIPIVHLFGLTIFSVRLPSLLTGCLIIPASFYLALKVFKKPLPASLTAGLIAISPWAIHTSRFAIEWLFGIPLIIIAAALLLENNNSKDKRKRFFMPLAAIMFSFSLYLYHSFRLFVPLLLLSYVFIYKKILIQKKKLVLISFLIGFFTILPLLITIKSNNLLARPTAVALFSDEILQNEFKEGMYRQTLLKLPFVRLFNNKIVFYSKEVLDHYLAHFSPQFLFSGKDVTPRVGIKKVGKLYLASLPFLIIGLIQLIKKNDKLSRFFLLWFFLAPLPSSLTLDSPHALRSLTFFPVVQIIIINGAVSAYHYIRINKMQLMNGFIAFTSLSYLAGFGYFLWRYFLFYPENTAVYWQDGHQEMVKKLNRYEKSFDQIIITTHYGQPHIFIAFFTPLEPKVYQEMIVDQKQIFNSRISFLRNIEFKQIKKEDFCLPNTLIVAREGMLSKTMPRLDIIFFTNRFHPPEIAFEFFDTNHPLIHQKICLASQKKTE